MGRLDFNHYGCRGASFQLWASLVIVTVSTVVGVGCHVGGSTSSEGTLGATGADNTIMETAVRTSGENRPTATPVGCDRSPFAAAPGTWVEVTSPPALAGARVFDGFANGTDELFFVERIFDEPTFASRARIARWHHGCWTVEDTPAVPGRAAAASVHGTGPTDLWAVVSDVVFHRDATGWSRFYDQSWRTVIRHPSFDPEVQLMHVRAAAPNNIWIAERRNVLNWNGYGWAIYNFDDPTYPDESASIGFQFSSVWVDGEDDVWVAGGSDVVGSTMDMAYVHHYNLDWTHHPVGLGTVNSIARGGAFLWLANSTLETIDGVVHMLTLRRFDGTSAPGVLIGGVDSRNQSVTLSSVWSRNANDVWASGEDVARFDGQQWSLVTDAPTAARPGRTEVPTFMTGDAHSVWLVAPGPRFFRTQIAP